MPLWRAPALGVLNRRQASSRLPRGISLAWHRRTTLDAKGQAMPDDAMIGAAGDTGAMGAKLLPFTSIPVIDLAPLFGTDRAALEATARELGEACQTVGFFYIRNHGIPES